MKPILPVILASLLVAGLSPTRADEPAEYPVLIVTMELVNGVFSLREFSIEPGVLPEVETEAAEGIIRYVVMDHSGRPMTEGLMTDPRYFDRPSIDDEEEPELDVPDSVDCALFLPYDRAMHQIHFAKIISVSDSAGVQMTRTESMGSVYVELHGDEE